MGVELGNIFDSAVNNSLFKDKAVLQAKYHPDTILHRDEQIEQVAGILAPSLRGEHTSNLFVYGQTGCISGDSLVYTEQGYLPIKKMEKKLLRVLSFNLKTKKYECRRNC